MPRELFTAADIRRVVREQQSEVLIISPDDIVTHEAVDVAHDLGVRLVRERSSNPVSPTDQPLPLATLKVALGATVVMEPFGEGMATPGTNVRLKDVITSADGSPMAAGYMMLDKGEFSWTLTYDEIDIVLEGELVITRGENMARAAPGDMIFIPKGSSITFGTPCNVRFVYVTFPANWNEQEERARSLSAF